MKIMIVDDEAGIRDFISVLVREAGFEACCYEGGIEALEAFPQENPDLVILDVMMPKLDGYEVCRRIREVNERVPVLFLSAKSDIIDKRVGFSKGADDYLGKPFDEEELILRIHALARRTKLDEKPEISLSEKFTLGDFRFDVVKHQVSHRGDSIVLTPKEFQLLLHLALNHGVPMDKEELTKGVWGQEYLDDAIGIAVYIRRIREKIEDNPAKPKYLQTVWGIGYVFEA